MNAEDKDKTRALYSRLASSTVDRDRHTEYARYVISEEDEVHEV